MTGCRTIATPAFTGSKRHGRPPFRFATTLMAGLLAALCFGPTARAALQFDVFLGYGGQPTGMDGLVREAGWFAMGCEVYNDGPGFNAVVEVKSSDSGQGQTRRLAVELPTNTRKRFVLPVFAPGRGGAWDVRLLDDRGRVRSEVLRVAPRVVVWEGLLLGAVPRTYAGAPRFPSLDQDVASRGDLQPLVARLPVELLPDNPIAYEGLSALYLNSEKALELRDPQVQALLEWVHAGGHLLVAVEQPADVNATPWLNALMPCSVGPSVNVQATGELYEWLRHGASTAEAAHPGVVHAPMGTGMQTAVRYHFDSTSPAVTAGGVSTDPYAGLRPVPGFEGQVFSVVSSRPRHGEPLLEMGGKPLVVSGERGRGRVTALLFSPEREPFRSWDDREWFWSRLLRVPTSWFGKENLSLWGGYSADGVMGTMIDSRQVQKLPVKWLLLLLLAYLVVIGPLDQYVLKRLNRQMLTWVTFPAYVVLFSLLIYYIGYRLRAGETEWNELHVVDVIPRTVGAEWRGRTFASIYSPVNAPYRLESEVQQSTLRGEFLGFFGGNRESGRMELEQLDRGFRAEVRVPVWTSQLVICDWAMPERSPIELSWSGEGAARAIRVKNHLERELAEAKLVVAGQVLEVGVVPPGGEVTVRLSTGGADLMQQVYGLSYAFRSRVEARQQALGSSEGQWLELNLDHLLGLSFIGVSAEMEAGQRQCVSPDGFDLTPLVQRGDAVLLAMVRDLAAVPSLRRFEAVRTSQNTLFRIAASPGSTPSL